MSPVIHRLLDHDDRFQTVHLLDGPLPLDCGVALAPVSLAYRTYGRMAADGRNAVLLCHALTGDQFVAEDHPVTGRPGWWSHLVGPGRAIDTRRWFVVCANVLGGCMGSSGPASLNPATGTPWGLEFPVVTIDDMVRAHRRLLDHLGVRHCHAVVGGSMGAMQVLSFAAQFPDFVDIAVPVAGSWRHSAQNIAFHEVGRQAIMADPDWHHGRYFQNGLHPRAGLAVARMTAHITYLSETALHRKFGRNLQDRPAPTYGFDADFQVESYLRHQGSTFVDRFDANSYLYITRAMDYFDLTRGRGRLTEVFEGSRVRFCVVSFSSDWLFPTAESRTVVNALNAAGAEVSFVEIESDKGHDAFLLDEPAFERVLAGALGERDLAAVEQVADQSAQVHRPLPVPPFWRRRPRPEAGEGGAAPPPGRVDFPLIAELIGPEARSVIDVGCGDGALLAYLLRHGAQAGRPLAGRGLEKDPDLVAEAVGRGLIVVQGTAEHDLALFAQDSFDVAVLSLTLQQVRDAKRVMEELSRIAPVVVVSFLNFGHWRVRRALLVGGRMPITRHLPHGWWDTPNIHHLTIQDFLPFCGQLGLAIERGVILDEHQRVLTTRVDSLRANLMGLQGLFRLRRVEPGAA